MPSCPPVPADDRQILRVKPFDIPHLNSPCQITSPRKQKLLGVRNSILRTFWDRDRQLILYPTMTIREADAFYKLACFEPAYREKMVGALRQAGLPEGEAKSN
jgi:hypothetical protein